MVIQTLELSKVDGQIFVKELLRRECNELLNKSTVGCCTVVAVNGGGSRGGPLGAECYNSNRHSSRRTKNRQVVIMRLSNLRSWELVSVVTKGNRLVAFEELGLSDLAQGQQWTRRRMEEQGHDDLANKHFFVRRSSRQVVSARWRAQTSTRTALHNSRLWRVVSKDVGGGRPRQTYRPQSHLLAAKGRR